MPFKNFKNYRRSKNDIKRFLSLPTAFRKITFYSEDNHSFTHFEALIEQLVTIHNEKVCYLTSDPCDPIFENPHENLLPFYVGEGMARISLFYKIAADVVIMTMPDIETYHLKRSIAYPVHYVYLFHAMVSTHSNYRLGAFDHFDSIFCTGPYQLEEIRKTETIYQLKEKHLFEDGYRKLEQLMTEFHKHKEKYGELSNEDTKTVILAPSWGEHSILNTCGHQLIEHLISAGYFQSR